MEAGDRIDSFRRDRRRLVERLRTSGVEDLAILHAFDVVPRHHFVPEELWGQAYEDMALPIGSGQTISSPSVHALCLRLAGISGGERVLEVGTGSGFQTALLATLGVQVFSIERVERLSARARERLNHLDISAHLAVGDGTRGWPEQAPFDSILVGAAAETLPGALLAQLRDGGHLIIPVSSGTGRRERQTLMRVTRRDQEYVRESVEQVLFVPLIADPADETGSDLQDTPFDRDAT